MVFGHLEIHLLLRSVEKIYTIYNLSTWNVRSMVLEKNIFLNLYFIFLFKKRFSIRFFNSLLNKFEFELTKKYLKNKNVSYMKIY